LALLGTQPDAVLAKKLNRTTESIKSQRQNKDVPGNRTLHFWTPAEDEIVMSCSYKEAARQLDLPQVAVETRRRALRADNVGRAPRAWTAEEIAMLGKYSDTELAQKLKRSRSTVIWKRREMEIHSQGDHGRPWTAEEEQQLGKRSDAQLALVLKRGIKAVQKRRLKLGILFRGPNGLPNRKLFWNSRRRRRQKPVDAVSTG
jgi:hypothetical protein